MSENKNVTYGGPGFATLLSLLFIGLKLGGVITWSWLWVLCPLWIGLAIFLAITLIFVVVALISGLIIAIYDL